MFVLMSHCLLVVIWPALILDGHEAYYYCRDALLHTLM